MITARGEIDGVPFHIVHDGVQETIYVQTDEETLYGDPIYEEADMETEHKIWLMRERGEID